MEINESSCLHVRGFDFPYIEILIVTNFLNINGIYKRKKHPALFATCFYNSFSIFCFRYKMLHKEERFSFYPQSQNSWQTV